MKTRILFNLLFAYVLSVTWAFGQWTNVPIETNTYDQSETAIAYNPSNSNTMIAVWNDFRVTGSTNAFSKPGFAFSTNGGASWSSNIMTPTGYNNGWDPSAAFNSSGKAFYCYVAQKNPGDTILGPVYVSRTTNLGSTWYHQKVSQYDSLQDKPYIAVDNTGGSRDGRIYVTWTDFYGGSQQILFAYSTNGGSAWTTPTQLVGTANAPTWQSIVAKPDTHHLNPTSGSFVQGSVPAVAPNGDLYVVWLYAQLDSNRAYIKVRRSTDGGSSFQNEVVAAYSPYLEIGYLYYKGPFRATSFPTIAIDPSSGHIYVAYSDGGSQRINFARSTNSGTSWSTPIYASEGNTGYDQFFPWMTVSQSGTISIVY